MKVSIVTICYNSEKHLKETIHSVLQQDYPDIEYIIVDGSSTDNTIAIIKSFGDKIAKFQSEKDKGLYDALNKGIKLATGDIIGFIHADDMLYSNDCISTLVQTFQKTDASIVYGDAICVDANESSKVIRFWKGEEYNRDKFIKGWMPPHLSTYIKRDLYTEYGLFNTKYRIAADYELLLRFLYKHHAKTVYIPKTIVRFRLGGMSNSSIKNIMKANYEVYMSWKENGLKVSPLIIPRKLFSKIKQLRKAKSL